MIVNFPINLVILRLRLKLILQIYDQIFGFKL